MSIGLYIHIPFCLSKCNYCDFYSITKLSLADAYVDTVVREINLYRGLLAEVSSIYIGGGSPSVLEIRQVERILRSCYEAFKISINPEITIEVNPGNLQATIAESYRLLGINRISIGVQSFDTEDLRLLGRTHSVRDIYTCIERLKSVGFDNLSADLIFGIPYQSLESFLNNIEIVASLGIPHISIYALSVEPYTRLHKLINQGKIAKPDEDETSAMYNQALLKLQSKGYRQYELSNFAMPNMHCRHNLKYWTMTEYIGLGASSHSFYNLKRYSNVRDVSKYISLLKANQQPVQDTLRLQSQDLITEAIMLGLRLTKGIDFEKYKEYLNMQALSDLTENGFVEIAGCHLRLTKKAYFVSNKIIAMILK